MTAAAAGSPVPPPPAPGRTGAGPAGRAGPAFIEVRDLWVRFTTDRGTVEALAGVDLRVAEGELVAVLGPSGCGKSTLLRVIAGLRRPTSGEVRVGGMPVTGPIANVGIVFQSPALLRWRRVLDNVLLPAELAGQSPGPWRARARELLARAGLEGFEDRFPWELSGGMQQRVALCRALLLDPPLLLMDEPFGALDAMTRDEMNLELLRIWQASAGPEALDGRAGAVGETRRKTILFVTHSIPEAVFLADWVLVMTARPGRVDAMVQVPLARPRTIDMRAHEAFGRLTLEIYRRLKVQPGALVHRD